MQFYTNKYGINIGKWCKTCSKRVESRSKKEGGSLKRRVKCEAAGAPLEVDNWVCDSWSCRYEYAKLGSNGTGKVKRQEYLAWFAARGGVQEGETLEGVRRMYEEESGLKVYF